MLCSCARMGSAVVTDSAPLLLIFPLHPDSYGICTNQSFREQFTALQKTVTRCWVQSLRLELTWRDAQVRVAVQGRDPDSAAEDGLQVGQLQRGEQLHPFPPDVWIRFELRRAAAHVIDEMARAQISL